MPGQPTQLAIGSKLYLFSHSGDQQQAEHLVISSHGEYTSRPELGKQTGMFRKIPGFGGWIKTPANQAFHFYCPHGYILQVPQPDNTPGTRFIVTQWNRINH